MQVFKTYFKILNRYKANMIMYVVIFAIVLFCFIIPNMTGDNEGYVAESCNFALFDYDNSNASKKLADYLSKKNEIVDIAGDEKEIIQDELYYRNITCVLRIPEGFEENLKKGNTEEILEVVTIPGTTASTVFETEMDSYLSSVITYVKAGFSIDQAMEKAEKALDVTVDVTIPGKGNGGTFSARYYFYNYLGWIVIMIMFNGICPVLMTFRRKELRNRIECSSYRFVNLNKELLLGVMVTGLGICMILAVLSVISVGKAMMNISGLLNVVNLICYAFVALSMVYVVSCFITKLEMLSMISNIIALGMSFLCGVFVPKEFLGDKVIKFAHFLPTYWYNEAVTGLEHYTPEALPELAQCMGIELLFALVIVVLGLAVARKQQMK